jgi:hypothetical protein
VQQQEEQPQSGQQQQQRQQQQHPWQLLAAAVDPLYLLSAKSCRRAAVAALRVYMQVGKWRKPACCAVIMHHHSVVGLPGFVGMGMDCCCSVNMTTVMFGEQTATPVCSYVPSLCRRLHIPQLVSHTCTATCTAGRASALHSSSAPSSSEHRPAFVCSLSIGSSRP